MGVINVTPDSFYGKSRAVSSKEILNRAEQMLEEGATFLDVGGYSTRPGATDITIEEEINRVQEHIENIKKTFPHAIVSIDTFRSEVVKVAVNQGADLVNDVSGGLLDENMFNVVGELKVPYILMHMRGNPQNMVSQNDYTDLLPDIIYELSKRVQLAISSGIKDIIIDPGLGFAKNVEQNFHLMDRLNELSIFEKPLLIGVSRKSMIYKSLDITPEESLNGTTVLNTVALLKGANVLRVHDVKPAVEAVKLIKSLKH